jgi:hypothetical protein
LLSPSLCIDLGQGGGREQEVGLENKGEGSWFQARDLSGQGFTTMSKASVFQVSGGFFPLAQGVTPRYYYLYWTQGTKGSQPAMKIQRNESVNVSCK